MAQTYAKDLYRIFVSYYKNSIDILVQSKHLIVSTQDDLCRNKNRSIKREAARLGFQLHSFRKSRTQKIVCSFKFTELKQFPSSSFICYLVSDSEIGTFWTQTHSHDYYPIKIFCNNKDITYKLTGNSRLSRFSYWYLHYHLNDDLNYECQNSSHQFRNQFRQAKTSKRISNKYYSHLLKYRSITFIPEQQTTVLGRFRNEKKKSPSSVTKHQSYVSNIKRVQHSRPVVDNFIYKSSCLTGPVLETDNIGRRLYLKMAGLSDDNSEPSSLIEEDSDKGDAKHGPNPSANLSNSNFSLDYSNLDNTYQKSLLLDAETLRAATIYVSMSKYPNLWTKSHPTFNRCSYGVHLTARGLPTDIDKLERLILEVCAPYITEKTGQNPLFDMAKHYALAYTK